MDPAVRLRARSAIRLCPILDVAELELPAVKSCRKARSKDLIGASSLREARGVVFRP